jgi:hypothetical protein
MYSVVPLIYGVFGASADIFGDWDADTAWVLLGMGLLLFLIGLGLLIALAPGKPRLWLGVILTIYGMPFLLTALPLGIAMVGLGAWFIYTSQRRISVPGS